MLKQYLKKLIKEVLEKDGIDSLKIGQHTAYVRNDKVHVSAATPKLQLQGTEASAMNLSLRENAGVIELYDETATVVRASWNGTTGRRITPLIAATEIASDAVITAKILDANVTLAKIVNGAGLSLIGRSANTAGVNAAIVGTDGQVARVAGTVLGFGTVVAAGIAPDAVITAKILDANVTEPKIVASSNTGLGVLRVARAKYRFDPDGGAISTITPALNATIPDNAIIIGGTINSTTAAVGATATISFGTSAGSSATSLLGATAVADFSADAKINSVATFAASVKMTAAGSITLTIATADLTAGVIEVTVLYFVAAA